MGDMHLRATFDCPLPCGTQLEVDVVLDDHSVRCDGHCDVESGCDAEEARWHAVAPVQCSDCGRVHTIDELNENDALHVSVLASEAHHMERR